jgi:hypothetical protein
MMKTGELGEGGSKQDGTRSTIGMMDDGNA